MPATGRVDEARERRETTLLISEVTRQKRRLDHILAHYTTKPLKRLHQTLVLQILRLGAYELVDMKKPDHVIHDHVALAKAHKMDKLVNGILRNIIRDRESKTLPEPTINFEATRDQIVEAFGVVHSHPAWMIERWIDGYGVEQTIQIMEHNNNPAMQGVRCCGEGDIDTVLRDLKAEGVDVELSTYLPTHFLRVQSGLQSIRQAFKDRRLVAQDEGAGFVVTSMLTPQPGERILDCCSAPGGKLFFMAELMHGKGVLVALEPSRSRLRKMEETSEQCGFQFIQFHQQRLEDFANGYQYEGEDALFDRVLIDAPCTGTGVMSKKADLRWKRKEHDINDLITLQDKLLDAASQLVRVNGILVYSTCSIETEENGERVLAFLASHSSFRLECPETVSENGRRLIAAEGWMQSLPHVHGIDGAFAARLRRVS